MANPTLSTAVSRRSMLAGGAAVIAAPTPVFAAWPVADLSKLSEGGPDADLLWRIAAARDGLAAYHRADAVSICLHRALSAHPDFPDHLPRTREEGDRWDALLDRTGVMAADARCEWLYGYYETALATAFAVPARTLVGVHGKLRLAITAVKEAQRAVLDPADCRHLDDTLGDLARLVAEYGRAGPPPP